MKDARTPSCELEFVLSAAESMDKHSDDSVVVNPSVTHASSANETPSPKYASVSPYEDDFLFFGNEFDEANELFLSQYVPKTESEIPVAITCTNNIDEESSVDCIGLDKDSKDEPNTAHDPEDFLGLYFEREHEQDFDQIFLEANAALINDLPQKNTDEQENLISSIDSLYEQPSILPYEEEIDWVYATFRLQPSPLFEGSHFYPENEHVQRDIIWGNNADPEFSQDIFDSSYVSPDSVESLRLKLESDEKPCELLIFRKGKTQEDGYRPIKKRRLSPT